MRMDKDPKFIRFPESLWAFATIFPRILLKNMELNTFSIMDICGSIQYWE